MVDNFFKIVEAFHKKSDELGVSYEGPDGIVPIEGDLGAISGESKEKLSAFVDWAKKEFNKDDEIVLFGKFSSLLDENMFFSHILFMPRVRVTMPKFEAIER